MGSIIYPWNLVTLFMVTSAAAMVHSAGDMDVRSATGNHLEPRQGTNGLQDCISVTSTGHIIESQFHTYEDYQICIIMSRFHLENKGGNIMGSIEFESRQRWGGYLFLQKTNTPGATCRCIEKRAVYYEGDEVAKIHLMNDCIDCTWYPKDIVVKIPQRAQCYVCDWATQCSNIEGVIDTNQYFTECNIDNGQPTTVTCALQGNSHPYC